MREKGQLSKMVEKNGKPQTLSKESSSGIGWQEVPRPNRQRRQLGCEGNRAHYQPEPSMWAAQWDETADKDESSRLIPRPLIAKQPSWLMAPLVDLARWSMSSYQLIYGQLVFGRQVSPAYIITLLLSLILEEKKDLGKFPGKAIFSNFY